MTAPITIRAVTMDSGLAACHALRRQVFCGEQQLFQNSDQDEIDANCVTVGAFTQVGERDHVIGTVRVHSFTPGQWAGSRLAVARAYRGTAHAGTQLIRFAVCYAHANGAKRFTAHVQQRNAAMFQALHWQTLKETILHGYPHHLMQADLAHYPASGLAEFAPSLKHAA